MVRWACVVPTAGGDDGSGLTGQDGGARRPGSRWPPLPPVSSTNRQTASTLGPMDPAAKSRLRKPAGVSRRMGVASRFPKSRTTCLTSVTTSSMSASRASASTALVRSLSTTASTPCSSPRSSRMTGTPPPPAQTTTAPLSRSSRISRVSTTRCGRGEPTTRRQPVPSALTTQPRSAATSRRLLLGVHLADELGGVLEGGVGGLDQGLVDDGGDLAAGQRGSASPAAASSRSSPGSARRARRRGTAW